MPTIGAISVTFSHSEGVYSFHGELITRAFHKQPNFADDNGMVLDVLVVCLKNTIHISDLKPFQKRRYVREALSKLVLHNMVNSYWGSILSEAEYKVLTFKWNGKNSRYMLDRHIYSHRSAQNDMVRAEDRI